MAYPAMVGDAAPPADPRDIIDFLLGLVVFAVAGACALLGVVLIRVVDESEQYRAFRVAAIGITAFVAYYLLHPYVGTVA